MWTTYVDQNIQEVAPLSMLQIMSIILGKLNNAMLEVNYQNSKSILIF